MSICVDLEDQLWAMCQGPQVPDSVKRLWPEMLARTHTAHGRLSSMLQLTDTEKPEQLAELGLINEGDKKKQFMHYQEPSVPIESIYEPNLVNYLEKQMPSSALLKGLSTWNVKMDQTLNSMPPSEHVSGLPAKHGKDADKGNIDEVQTVGNFVLTGSHQEGSVNLFSTRMGLTRLLQHNFTTQGHQSKDESAQLRHLAYKKVFENPLVRIMSKKGTSQADSEPPLSTSQPSRLKTRPRSHLGWTFRASAGSLRTPHSKTMR